MIYFADNKAGLIKIGYARDVAKRFTALRTASPLLEIIATMEGTRRQELAIHERLSEFRRGGEWFLDCSEVRAGISLVTIEGIEEYPGRRRQLRSQVPETKWLSRATSLVNIILEGRKADDIKAIEKSFGLPAGLLWVLKYRPREPGVSEYFLLLRAAQKAIDQRQQEIDQQSDFVRSLEREDAESTEALLDVERRLASAEAFLREAKGE